MIFQTSALFVRPQPFSYLSDEMLATQFGTNVYSAKVAHFNLRGILIGP